MQIFATYWLCLFSLYISANKITVLNIYDFFCKLLWCGMLSWPFKFSLSTTHAVQLLLQQVRVLPFSQRLEPAEQLSKQCMKETNGYWHTWLFFLCPILIGCFAQASSLPALSRFTLCCLWLRHPARHLTFLSFFLFSHALSYLFFFFFLFFILCDINPAYFFIIFKNKWKEHNVLSLPWSFFFYIAVSFLSHILCWVLVDCNLFGAEAFLLLFDCTVPSIVCSWISIGLWTLV